MLSIVTGMLKCFTFVLTLSNSSRESFLLRRLVMVKCILARLMGGCRLAFKWFTDGIIEHGA